MFSVMWGRALCDFRYDEALPGVLGNRGKRVFISGEQGNKGQILRGTKTILGNREHKKTNFDFWGTGEQANLFQGNKGTSTPWEGLYDALLSREASCAMCLIDMVT